MEVKLKIKIPISFNIFNQTYKVLKSENIGRKHDAVGMADTRNQEVIIQSNENGFMRKESQIEQAYLHEVFHVILRELNYSDLDENEQFVDNIASALHQILTTSKYS